MSRLTRAALAVLLVGAGGYGVYWWVTRDGQEGRNSHAEVVRVAVRSIRDPSAARAERRHDR